jgi:hypothetical protein
MQLRAAYRELLALRGLDRSDGRPLYRYRFQQTEYEGVRALLKQNRQIIQKDSYGFALFVMFVAEWYRRDRTGGHWDWIRPLREIGIAYEANTPNSALSYSQLKFMVEQGLGIWKRPLISRGQLLYSVVGEAGFPVAALEESRLGVWLQRSVLAIEKGALPEDAVASEATRVSDRHAQVMFDVAVDLCRVAVTLRNSLGENRASTDDQLISQLDRTIPDWRARLPFDIGDKGFFALFRDLITAKGDAPPKALRVVRTIRKSSDGKWEPYASVALSGEVVPSSVAPSLGALLANTDRVRLIGRGAWAEFGHPLAVLEKWRSDDKDKWEVRPLQRETHHPLGLSRDVLLGAATTGRAVVEFVPDGGHALLDPVIAFRCDLDQLQDADELQSIGSNSARARSSWLVLGLTSEAADIRFEGETVELGVLGTQYRLVGFNGVAKYKTDGVDIVWATGADRDHIVEVGVAGETVYSTRGVVYLGRPTLWVSVDGLKRRIADRNIRWRPAGTRTWRRVIDADPVGSIDLAAFDQDKVIATVRVAVLPKTFRLGSDSAKKALTVYGHADAVVSGTKDKPLQISRASETIVVDLSSHNRGEDVGMEFRWDTTTVTLTIVDPFSESLLLAPSGRAHPSRGLIAVGRLHGYRLIAPGKHKLLLEARNRTQAVAHATVAIDSSTPLMSLETQLRELLGSAATIDARVRLAWEGSSGHFAEIGWYDIAEDLFSVLDGPSATLSAISIPSPSQSITQVAQQEKWALQGLLSKEISPGPWLVFGRRTDGGTIRPKVVPELLIEMADRPLTGPSVLDRAIGLSTTSDRRQLMVQWCQDPTSWSVVDTKKVVGICRAARGHGVPFNAFDVLEVIVDHPNALPRVLSACSTHEERTAVLALQNELPFLWCTSPIAAWINAYDAEVERLAAQLAVLGESESVEEARRATAKRLAQLGDLEAGVKSHAAAILRLRFSNHLEGIAMVKSTSDSRSLRTCADKFVAQHGERHFQGEAGSLAKLVTRYPSYWSRYDEMLWDPIVAPIVAAQMAAGHIPYSQQTIRQLRAVWHLDRDHFEASFAIAMSNEANGSIYIGGNR